MSDIQECSIKGCIKAATHIMDLDTYCDEHYKKALDEAPDEDIIMVMPHGEEKEMKKQCERAGCTRQGTCEIDGRRLCQWHYIGALNTRVATGNQIVCEYDECRRPAKRDFAGRQLCVYHYIAAIKKQRGGKSNGGPHLESPSIAQPGTAGDNGYHLLITRVAEDGFSETTFSSRILQETAREIIINIMGVKQ